MGEADNDDYGNEIYGNEETRLCQCGICCDVLNVYFTASRCTVADPAFPRRLGGGGAIRLFFLKTA